MKTIRETLTQNSYHQQPKYMSVSWYMAEQPPSSRYPQNVQQWFPTIFESQHTFVNAHEFCQIIIWSLNYYYFRFGQFRSCCPYNFNRFLPGALIFSPVFSRSFWAVFHSFFSSQPWCVSNFFSRRSRS